MYATIRRYTPKAGAVNKENLDELGHRLEHKFIPMLQDIPGFHCYYAVNVGNKELVTIGVFDNKSGATESTRRAADFVKNDPIKDRLGSPDVLEGELLVMKEAVVGAR